MDQFLQAPIIILAALAAAAMLIVIMIVRGIVDRRTHDIAIRKISEENAEESGVFVRRDAPLTLSPTEDRSNVMTRFDGWFARAVLRSGLGTSPGAVVALIALIGIAIGGTIYYFRENFVLAIVGGLIGILVPMILIAWLQSRYKNKLQMELPNAYYLMAGALRAGQTLNQAIELYAIRGNQPLADEFLHCAGLLKLGMSAPAALQATAHRVGLLDFNLLVSTVGVYSQTGGNLANLLDRLAASVRDRNQYRGHFMAATAQSRVVATMLAAAVPLYLVAYIFIEPDYVQAFLNSPNWWPIVGICLGLELIGIVWVWKLLKIEY